MQAYQKEFINYLLNNGVLRFGQFTLKSGRVSPYFFNAGLFNTGNALAMLARCYAHKIVESGIAFDVLFGPAYKGIPLVAATSIALSEMTGRPIPFCFDRKEVKQHGEGGMLVGAPMQGRVLIIDDVITAGTAIRHSIELIRESQAALAGVVIAFDRQERGEGELSAVAEVAERFFTRVYPLIQLNDVIDFVKERMQENDLLQTLNEYREKYGANT